MMARRWLQPPSETHDVVGEAGEADGVPNVTADIRVYPLDAWMDSCYWVHGLGVIDRVPHLPIANRGNPCRLTRGQGL